MNIYHIFSGKYSSFEYLIKCQMPTLYHTPTIYRTPTLYTLLFKYMIKFFFPEFNIRLYDKNSESDYFFFLHQNQNIFFSNIGNQNISLEKNHTPPPLQVKWSFPKQ